MIRGGLEKNCAGGNKPKDHDLVVKKTWCI